MNFSKGFARQPRTWILAEMAVALLLVGLLDFVTGFEISFLLLYGAPIFVAAWFCGKRSAFFAASLAAVIWAGVDHLAGRPYLPSWIQTSGAEESAGFSFGWIQAWETGVHVMHIGFFFLVAIVGSSLRLKGDRAAARIALLERSQRLEREIVNISEAEQSRIGQDLHDGLCQYLAALSCAAASLQNDLEKRWLPNEAEAAGELVTLLQDAIVQTRELAHGLVPAHVAQVGLVLALQSLAHSVSRLQNVKCTFDCQGIAKTYEDSTARHLYRIAQEAINNAIRHGKARNICLSLEADARVTTLKVLDDGVGFSPAEVSGSGLGLNIMRYRARVNGGELNIEQPETGGTLVWCTANTDGKEDEVALN